MKKKKKKEKKKGAAGNSKRSRNRPALRKASAKARIPVKKRKRAPRISHASTGSFAAHYRTMLARGRQSETALESLGGPAESPPIDPSHADTVAQQWHAVVENFLDDDQKLHDICDQIAGRGKRALKILAEGDEQRLADPRTRASLEVIVRLDGSRPTFMVQHGKVNLETSPVGTWESRLNSSAGLLGHALACVGRIDLESLPKGFAGTGWLVQDNLILTNRHVLEEIGTQASDGSWTLRDGAAIDFGHEFRARASIARRLLRKVVFSGPDPINRTIDHAHLDLALIETDPPAPADKLDYYFAVDISPDWGARDQEVYVVGYPGAPRFGDEDLTLLEKLFKSTYGYKRCAPGVVTRDRASLAAGPRNWSLAHDATTLGGNSGSAILAFSREANGAGLHFGGSRGTSRENWGHILGLTLDSTDGYSAKTLRQHLEERGVDLIDPFA